MLYVSLIVEALRGRPALMFWTAALAQALLWVVVPSLFYAAPPGDLAQALAVGHEFQLGTHLGPPLAYWLADIAFVLGGMFAVYLLAQVCIVVAYWAVFALGREIVGPRHAVIAILLMVGIFAFTVPSPDFGPAVLGTALWALVLLHYWRALARGRRALWFVLGIEAGLLLLTTFVGALLIGLLCLYTATSERGRAALRAPEPWIALALALVVAAPHFVWLAALGDIGLAPLEWLRGLLGVNNNLVGWSWLLAGLLVAHAGLIGLVALGSGSQAVVRERAPTIDRLPIDTPARRFVYFFAVLPSLTATFLAVLAARAVPLVSAAPVIVLSGLATVVAAGDSIKIYRERVVSYTWLGLLLAPPLVVLLLIAVLPWTFRTELRISRPANAMGRFFAETFERRTGQKLAVVAGDEQLAALVAVGAPSRPMVFVDAHPERSPWVGPEEVREHGAVVLWRSPDTAGTPPAEIKARFPDLVPEVPRTFAHAVQGMLPIERIGWAVIRPQGGGSQALPKRPAAAGR